MGDLRDIRETEKSPSQHMNFNGDVKYENSGYISIFLYNPDHIMPAGQYQEKTVNRCAYAINQLIDKYVHFLFIPKNVQEKALDNDSVKMLPQTGYTPTLLNTKNCNVPAVKREDGTTLRYAERYIYEYLYLGKWADGMAMVTEVREHSDLLKMMEQRKSVEAIIQAANSVFHPPELTGRDPKRPRLN
jgi:hypothetical protein